MRHPRPSLGFVAAVSVLALASASNAAEKPAEPVAMSAVEDYAKTVSAVCTVMSPRDQASGLAFFLNAAGVDKKPTKEATDKFCGAFKEGFPLGAAEAKAVLVATSEAGGAPAPLKKKKDKDKPPPADGGGGKGPGYFHLKIKILGNEFEIEIGRKTDPGSTQPAEGGASGGSGGDGGTASNDPPPYNPGPPPE